MEKKKKGHLSRKERIEIRLMRKGGKGFREIGRILGRECSTITRELRRNSVHSYASSQMTEYEKGSWSYEKSKARLKARAKKSSNILDDNPEVAKRVLALLIETKDSPEQIATIISKSDLGVKLSGKTIRRWINKRYPNYRQHFPHRGKRPRKSLTPRSNNKKQLAAPTKRNITQRPIGAIERLVLGHLELDMIVCSQSTKSILSIRDRKTRFCYLDFVDNLQADTVRQAIIRFLNQYPTGTIKTMTFDRGSEFAGVHYLEHRFQLLNYFCDAYCSWQKGSVENQNKEVRRHIPKGTNLDDISYEQLKRIEDLINAKPRKCLKDFSSSDAWIMEIRNNRINLH